MPQMITVSNYEAYNIDYAVWAQKINADKIRVSFLGGYSHLLPAQLLSSLNFVQINEDSWVNPKYVVSIRPTPNIEEKSGVVIFLLTGFAITAYTETCEWIRQFVKGE